MGKYKRIEWGSESLGRLRGGRKRGRGRERERREERVRDRERETKEGARVRHRDTDRSAKGVEGKTAREREG